MAFHTPNRKIRAIERRNAQLRAELFAKLFRCIGRAPRKAMARLRAFRFRRRN
ncbi:hypothetical protein [Halomonas binhaiensis]|uniref:Uncharacterized protein n=1 Tax=Halomonas binhaiensis TaxID=2562282 RepID=A0A7U3HWT1_9GAMM|nr:hypothetical protein [Halomonas binhaiensis]QRG26808.1 hypothetical protein E4T21_21495 [Halomonas binhaiensis]